MVGKLQISSVYSHFFKNLFLNYRDQSHYFLFRTKKIFVFQAAITRGRIRISSGTDTRKTLFSIFYKKFLQLTFLSLKNEILILFSLKKSENFRSGNCNHLEEQKWNKSVFQTF